MGAMWAELATEVPMPGEQDIRECFDQIDADSDGRLTLGELLQALQNDRDFLHIMLPNLGAKAMMREMGLEMLGNPMMAGLSAPALIDLDIPQLPEFANLT